MMATGLFTRTLLQELPFPVSSASIAATDLDNDHDLDLIILSGSINYRGPGTILLINDGFGSFTNIPCHNLPSSIHGTVNLIDTDSDGIQELFITAGNNTQLYKHLGNYEFLPVKGYLLPKIILGDAKISNVLGDSAPDVILSVTPVLYENINIGLKQTCNAIQGYYKGDLAIGDIDNDGDKDICITGEYISSALVVLFNNGNGSFNTSFINSSGKNVEVEPSRY